MVSSVCELTCFISKFHVFYRFWLYKSFSTRLPRWLVSWKRPGLASGLTFDHAITDPGKRHRVFCFAYAPYNETIKLSINMENSQGKWVDLLSWLAPHKIEIKKLNPLTEPTQLRGNHPHITSYLLNIPSSWTRYLILICDFRKLSEKT